MDLNKLSTGEKVIAASGLLLFIFSFFPWFSVSGIPGSGGSGWDVGFLWGGLPALLGLALAIVTVIPLFAPDFKLPDIQGVTWGQVFLGAAGLAAFLVVLKLIIGHSIMGFSLDRSVGIFLAALAAAGLAAGGFLKFQEEKSGASSAPPSSF